MSSQIYFIKRNLTAISLIIIPEYGQSNTNWGSKGFPLAANQRVLSNAIGDWSTDQEWSFNAFLRNLKYKHKNKKISRESGGNNCQVTCLFHFVSVCVNEKKIKIFKLKKLSK